MAETLTVIVICGSLRKGSYNAALAKALEGLKPDGMTLVEAPSYAGFPLYNMDVQTAGVPAEVTAFADAINAADGVIIVSPEYNWSIPGPLKNAIDWVSKLKHVPFKDKPVLLQSASPGQAGGSRAQYHMRMVMTSVEAINFGKPEVFVNHCDKKIDVAKNEITDAPTKDIVRQQLAAFAKFIARVKA